MRFVLAAVLCGALGGASPLFFLYRLRRARIERFARIVTEGTASPRDAVFQLARTLFLTVTRGPDPTFLVKFLTPLGPSPVAVLDHGGCCSGIHRLFIASLDAIGVRSAQITVYRQPGPVATHCLVQVALSPPLIIDVDYGVWYTHFNGHALNLVDLHSGVRPVFEPFVQARPVDGKFSEPPGYPSDPYYDFDFSSTRTANWTKTPVRRAIYRVLHVLTQGRVNRILLPPVCEWPEMILAVALVAIAVFIFAFELADKVI